MPTMVVCPLVSRDLQRSTRAVRSCLSQRPTSSLSLHVHPVVNSLDASFVAEFTSWCHSNGVTFDVTPSNGTPSKGKNEVLKYFTASGHDGLVMLDGDDMLYPTAAQQIERHVTQHSGTDLLIVKPSDQVVSEPGDARVDVGMGRHAICWGTNTIKMGYRYGPGRHHMFDEGYSGIGNLGGHVYYSRKLAGLVGYDEGQLLGEDLLFEFECLKLHLQGKISFWLSFASDVQLLDRTKENSNVQTNNVDLGRQNFDRLYAKVSEMLDPQRSSFDELPVQFPEMLLQYEEKIDFIARNF